MQVLTVLHVAGIPVGVDKGFRVQTIDRTVEILHAISLTPSGLSLTEIADQLRLPKTTVYRMLQALVRHDFLRKEAPTKVYRLGPALLLLGADSLNQWDLRSIALPYLQQLAHITNETVCLTALYKDTAVCLDTIESNRSVSFWVRIGREMDFHCAASAKAILAFQSEEQIERVLSQEPLQSYTSNTLTDVNALKEHFQTVRRQGYASCDGELEIGVKAVATPIMQRDGMVIGSVAIIAPAERLSGDARERILLHLSETSHQISLRLGYRSVSAVSGIPQLAQQAG
jgi:IclR family acetate operon transcriptional repressor